MNRRGDSTDTPGTTPDRVDEALAIALDALREVVDGVQASPVGECRDALMGQVRVLQDVIGAASAAQTVRIAQFATRGQERTEGGRWVETNLGVGNVEEFASDALAPVLGMSHGPAQRRVHVAAKLVADLPLTLGALADGELDLFRAEVVADELSLASKDTCAAVEGALHPDVVADTPMKARRRVRRILADVDTDAVRERAHRAKGDRFVHVRAGEVPGITEWWAQLPAAESTQCWAAIDALAQRRKLDDPDVRMNQARADAFVDLILGNAQVKTHVTVAVPVAMTETIAGGEPADPRDSAVEVLGAEVPGVGIVPSVDVASLVGGLGTTIGRMLIDHETGTTCETSIDRYRPSPAMIRHLQLRDGTCRFPNCGIRAERCEIDHVTPWPEGPTSIENLMALCRHHHRLKTHTRWRVRLSDTAEAIWIDPYGTEWVTRPRNHHHWSAA